MKKLLLTIVCLLSISIKSVAVDFFPISEVNNKHYSVGLLGGYVGYADDLGSGAFGFSVTAWGAYLDLIGWPRTHANDTGVDEWDDQYCFGVHLGYQIPITKTVRIVPLLGYTSVQEGTTDGGKWSVSNGRINNSFSADNEVSGFDYGGMLVFNYKFINFNAAVTRYAVYGGVSFEF